MTMTRKYLLQLSAVILEH